MKRILFYMMALILVASCSADPDKAPIITIDNAEIGAFPRTVNLVTGEYDLMDLAGSAYVHEIDFRSENGGANVSSYDLSIAFQDNNTGNGDSSTSATSFQSFGQSDFSDNADGNKSLTLNIPFGTAASAVGVDPVDVLPGDRFLFTATLTLDDGRVFTSGNTESTIFGPAFRAFFDFSVNATCPIPDEMFNGSYTMTLTSGSGGNPWGVASDPVLGEVTLTPVAGSSTKRVLNKIGILPNFGPFDQTPEIDFVCDQVVIVSGNPGASGCTVAGLALVSSFDGVSLSESVNIMDDSSFTLSWFEHGGGCGYVTPWTATLTKN